MGDAWDLKAEITGAEVGGARPHRSFCRALGGFDFTLR